MIATTTLTLLRTTAAVDDLGDPLEDFQPVAGAVAVPASLIERARTTYEPSTGIPRTIVYYKARLAGQAFPAVKGDSVRDESTAILYRVDSVRRTPRTLGGLEALALDLLDPTAE